MATGMCPGCSVAYPRQPAFRVFFRLCLRSVRLLNAMPLGFPSYIEFSLKFLFK